MPDREPARSRPRTFYLDPDAHPPLPWRWATARLTRARNYWLVSNRANGTARSRPVWGVWMDDAFYFDTGSSEAMLDRDPRVEVHLESGDEVVILTGTVQRVGDVPERPAVVDAYNRKYNWNWAPSQPSALFVLRPRTAVGWISDPTGEDWGGTFGATATRWSFEDAAHA